MRTLNKIVVACGVAAMVGMLGLAGTIATAANAYKQPAKNQAELDQIREKVEATPNDGCREL
jgi:hypothetical protein